MTQQENTTSRTSEINISDRTTGGWHSPSSVLPPEGEDVIIGYYKGAFYIASWKKALTINVRDHKENWYPEWVGYGSGGLKELDTPDFWMAIPSPLLTENLVDNVTNTQEKWYLFDMEPEHVDPRFQYWLAKHGIATRVNANGSRGVIASTSKELPPCFKDCLFEKPEGQLEPLSIVLEENERIPDIANLLNLYDQKNFKPSRPIRNPLSENFGRSPQRKVILEYFVDTLARVSELMVRINSCDHLGLNNEFSVEIKEVEDAVEFLYECIDNNLTRNDSNFS